MRQENRSSPKCQALSPQLAAMLFQKIRKHKNIEPWAVSSKNLRIRKIDARKIKLLSQDFARNSDSLREEGFQIARRYTVSREDILSRAKTFPRPREIKQSRAKILSRLREAQTVSRKIIQGPREERRFWRRFARRGIFSRGTQRIFARRFWGVARK